MKSIARFLQIISLLTIMVNCSSKKINKKLENNWKLSKTITPMYNPQDTGFRLKLLYSGFITQPADKSYAQEIKNSCKVVIVDFLPEYLLFDIEEWKKDINVKDCSVDSPVDIEAPSYYAKCHVYH